MFAFRRAHVDCHTINRKITFEEGKQQVQSYFSTAFFFGGGGGAKILMTFKSLKQQQITTTTTIYLSLKCELFLAISSCVSCTLVFPSTGHHFELSIYKHQTSNWSRVEFNWHTIDCGSIHLNFIPTPRRVSVLNVCRAKNTVLIVGVALYNRDFLTL